MQQFESAKELPGFLRTASSDEKVITTGTHRVCSPEETLARVAPMLPHLGITRVAEVTWLDKIGIPVFQAIRPNSRTLSLSQGKGVTRALAKVSGIMEAVELWHAETPSLPEMWAEVGELAGTLPYALSDLNLVENHLLHDHLKLRWFPAHILGSGESTYIPADYVCLDYTIKDAWLPVHFIVSSNGLASGNTLEEAILHGLYEVLERDNAMRIRAGELPIRPVDPGTVDGIASAPLLEKMLRAGVTVQILDITGQTNIACFVVNITSKDYPMIIHGYGCHLDRDVALSRALTEAAQARLGIISGSRDDLLRRIYTSVWNKRSQLNLDDKEPLKSFHDIPSTHHPYLEEDVNTILQKLGTFIDCPPLVVDLTHPEMNLPVVFVVVPRMRFSEEF